MFCVVDVKDPVVLWWTPFTGETSSVRQCGDVRCYITEDRVYFQHNLLQAVIFYGSNLDIFDLPLPRRSTQLVWALLHEESPKNLPTLSHEAMLSLFNYSSTFSRHSDVPLTLQYLDSFELLTTKKYFVSTVEKDMLVEDLAPVLYIQSSCSAPSGRDSYVLELQKHIRIDSYGKCLQNKKLPEIIANHSEDQDSDDFLKFVARYKFTLALENAICEDYITEKLWRPLVVGSVPIYMGSPSIRGEMDLWKIPVPYAVPAELVLLVWGGFCQVIVALLMDWLPNENSAILISDFRSPRDLAEHLEELNANATAYERHLRHKLGRGGGRVENQRLLSALESRPPGPNWSRYVKHFECLVCKRLHCVVRHSTTVGIRQYNCPEPVSPLSGQPDDHSLWNEVWRTGRCEAEVARSFVVSSRTYSQQEFTDQLLELMDAGEC
ncbi:hypothetical protein PR048_019244 [Dryococelus australis]|uniref:Fucosyltransferase n=1 Tax=Dryococelus australis TaxID=614101 RepID=A0ABQ9H393_9NEOP|nr:hypothetical protein PR048_019244 [Dryococelus australis]